MNAKSRQFAIESTQPAGGSVLDELTGASTPAAAAAAPPGAAPPDRRPSRAAQPGGVPRSGARASIRVQVPEVLADRFRGAVAALAYQDRNWSSLNAAVTAAMERFVEDAEAAYNNGDPFPWEPGGQLQPGRRVGHWNS
jgi:hypothetical protein